MCLSSKETNRGTAHRWAATPTSQETSRTGSVDAQGWVSCGQVRQSTEGLPVLTYFHSHKKCSTKARGQTKYLQNEVKCSLAKEHERR